MSDTTGGVAKNVQVRTSDPETIHLMLSDFHQ